MYTDFCGIGTSDELKASLQSGKGAKEGRNPAFIASTPLSTDTASKGSMLPFCLGHGHL